MTDIVTHNDIVIITEGSQQKGPTLTINLWVGGGGGEGLGGYFNV
jgi:hypothetical protein